MKLLVSVTKPDGADQNYPHQQPQSATNLVLVESQAEETKDEKQ